MDLPIGEEIARRRKHRGVTQQELAAFMNVSKSIRFKMGNGTDVSRYHFTALISGVF